LIPKLADSTPTINDDDADNQHDIITSASEHLSSRGDKPTTRSSSILQYTRVLLHTKRPNHLDHQKKEPITETSTTLQNHNHVFRPKPTTLPHRRPRPIRQGRSRGVFTPHPSSPLRVHPLTPSQSAVGAATGSEAWKVSAESDKQTGIDAMKAASQNRDANRDGFGKVEEMAGKAAGCEGMEKEGAASKTE